MSKLHIYKASAGSGKTYKLVQNYIAYVLQPGHYFDEVIAITFTNKAAGEMKQRIIEQLQHLGHANKDDAYLLQLQELFSERDQPLLSADEINSQATAVLSDILHNYSRLSVGTIDAFFQRILRAFARELNVSVNYNLELDRQRVQIEITDRLLDMLGDDRHKDLTQWLLEFMNAKMEDDRSWNLHYDLIDFSRQLFRDEFIELLSALDDANATPSEQLKKRIATLQKELNNIIHSFENDMDRIGREAEQIMQQFGVNYTMFSGGKRSAVNHINKIRKEQKKYEPTKTLIDSLAGDKSFIKANDANTAALQEALDAGLEDKLHEAVDLFQSRYELYNSARKCARFLYQLGILSDMASVLADLRSERNMLLIDDTDRLLQGVTAETDAPFIYEKVGSRYKFFLLDEFQDTSNRQWRNLLPLLRNALDEGNEVLIVGDIKQSIYRWRGGNMELLREDVKRQLTGPGEPHKQLLEKTIRENYRSAPAVVQFNNALFSQVQEYLTNDDSFTFLNEYHAFNQLFQSAAQEINQRDGNQGLVWMKNVAYDRQEDELDDWREKHLDLLPGILQSLEEDGFAGNDLCMLVDTNWEGSLLADYLSRMKYKVISQESLLLGNSVRVSLVVQVLRWLHDPGDEIVKAQMIYEYLRLSGNDEATLNACFEQVKRGNYDTQFGFPEKIINGHKRLKHLPLYELTEEIIRLLGLNQIADAFVQQFRDKVLDFSGEDSQVISDFLEWWDEEGHTEALSATETGDAIRIMTIHKSKGLQFPVVILPFLDLEFKHKVRPLMWLDPDGHKPFNQLKYLPVQHFSHEEASIFSEQLAEETMLMTADQLNKWYVAFTRPRHRLYALFSHRKRYQATSAARLLSAMLPAPVELEGESFAQYWNEANNTFSYGKPEPAPKVQPSAYGVNSFDLSLIESHHWHQRATVRRQAVHLSARDNVQPDEKLQRGRVIHELLSRIEDAKDIDGVTKELIIEGWLPEKDAQELQNSLRELLQDDDVAQWFAPGWVPITERELLLANGGVLRPDRVITKGGKAQVIDYKSGEDRPKDRKQVLEYKSVLEEMGYEVTGCWLLYTGKGQVVKVHAGNDNGDENRGVQGQLKL